MPDKGIVEVTFYDRTKKFKRSDDRRSGRISKGIRRKPVDPNEKREIFS